MAIFTENPQTENQYFSLGDVLDKLTAFNAVYEANKNNSSSNNCKNPDDAAQWRKLVYDAVINCGGEQMELDFFEKIFGGKKEFLPAKKIHFRYNADMDRNIVSAQTITASGVNQPVTFQLHKSKHSADGKYSYAAENYMLYLYRDRQMVTITGVNKATDYGHLITVKPNNKSYQIKIRKDEKMLVFPARLVGGLDSHKPTTTYQSPGYTVSARPFRVRKDWSVAVDLQKGYEDILQWAIMFDDAGKEVDCWEAYEKTKTRSDMKWAKNLLFFLGQKVTNTDLLGIGKVTVDYSGFDGYFNTMHYGGGTVLDFDANVGFDLEADFGAVILRNDAKKLTNEFVALHGKPFKAGLIRNANEHFKKNSGACTFESFKRMGGDEADIKKLGVDSYEYLGFSIHFKEVSALSDERGLGNFEFPHLAMLLPGNGLKDSKGRSVPAIQFFVPQGCSETGALEEYDWDNRKIKGEESLGGYLAETAWMVIHCPHQHIMANPNFSV